MTWEVCPSQLALRAAECRSHGRTYLTAEMTSLLAWKHRGASMLRLALDMTSSTVAGVSSSVGVPEGQGCRNSWPAALVCLLAVLTALVGWWRRPEAAAVGQGRLRRRLALHPAAWGIRVLELRDCWRLLVFAASEVCGESVSGRWSRRPAATQPVLHRRPDSSVSTDAETAADSGWDRLPWRHRRITTVRWRYLWVQVPSPFCHINTMTTRSQYEQQS